MIEGFNFQEILILLLLGTLFFKEQLWSLILAVMGKSKTIANDFDMPDWAAKLLDNQNALLQYGNHDMTDKYDAMIGKADILITTTNRIDNKVDEIMKYGLPHRV